MPSFHVAGGIRFMEEMPHLEDIFICYKWIETPVLVESGDKRWTYKSRRGVLFVNDGCALLPYFIETDGRWKVVFVEQFRIALLEATIEVPGGIVSEGGYGKLKLMECKDQEEVKDAMARELKEETGIEAARDRIKIVLNEWAWPSMTNAKLWGGIVEISNKDLPEENVCGEWNYGEYTICVVYDLIEILYNRETGRKRFDLLTSRLIDEVAKATGWLKKMY